jgi:hypothetical protein
MSRMPPVRNRLQQINQPPSSTSQQRQKPNDYERRDHERRDYVEPQIDPSTIDIRG